MTSRKNNTPRRAAMYIRVSPDGQTVDNQRLELEQAAESAGAGRSSAYMTITVYPAPSPVKIEKPLTGCARTPLAASLMW